MILSFPKPNLSILAWVTLVPWFFALDERRPKSAFFFSYLTGVIFFSGVLYWLTHVSTLGFSILALFLALFFAAFGVLFSICMRRGLCALLLLPCFWVFLEYIRNHLFTGFGWALLGHSQYQNLAFIQISDITAVYGVSFLIVLVNAGLWQILKRNIFLPAICIFSSLALTLSYGYIKLHYPPQKGEDIKVATIQGNIPQIVKWDPDARGYILEKYLRLTEIASGERPDIIIWPETSVPGYLQNDPALLQEISSLSKRIYPAYLLVGTPHEGERGKIYNSATLFFQGGIMRRYDKVHLVPFGEFIPLPAIFSRFSFAGLIGNFTPAEDYTIFCFSKEKQRIRLAALICFEDVFPHLARRFTRRGADLLVNMTNDAWFKDSSEPEQHLQASVFRAVENRVNLVRSANTGVSCFINPWGKVLSRVRDASGQDVLVEGQKTESLKIVSMYSFYRAFGDVFAWGCSLVTLGALTIALRRKRKPL